MGISTEDTANRQRVERSQQFLKALAASAEGFTWEHLAACREWNVNWFFDWYEENKDIRPLVDQRCYSCPVQKECGLFAKRNKKEGVWGGVYWTPTGQVDKTKNDHKTEEEWEEIQNVLGESLDIE